MVTNTGVIYCISAPSGAGKTSMIAELLRRQSALRLSISYTTRPQRPGEVDGESYFFVTEEKFQDMIDHKEFLEYATVFQYRYGTARYWIQGAIRFGKNIVLELDWQGAREVRRLLSDSNMVVSIYILPPSEQALITRLQERGQDSQAVIENRIAQAKNEMSHYAEYDYLIINDNFENAVKDLETIFLATQLSKTVQEQKQAGLLQTLVGNGYNDMPQ